MHISSRLHSTRPVPQPYRSSFLHLYLNLAWYNLALNAALLLGALIGPAIAGALGLPLALGISVLLRFLMAIGILLWA